jgi:hypothetical protein
MHPLFDSHWAQPPPVFYICGVDTPAGDAHVSELSKVCLFHNIFYNISAPTSQQLANFFLFIVEKQGVAIEKPTPQEQATLEAATQDLTYGDVATFAENCAQAMPTKKRGGYKITKLCDTISLFPFTRTSTSALVGVQIPTIPPSK